MPQHPSSRFAHLLPLRAIVNATALVTLNKTDLSDHAGRIPDGLLDDIDRGLRALSLEVPPSNRSTRCASSSGRGRMSRPDVTFLGLTSVWSYG